MPPNDVVAKFEDLRNALSEDDEDRLFDWLEYFQRNWVGPLRRNVRRAPRFPVVWWNCHQRVLAGRARTNNSIEGWHRAFDQRVGARTPLSDAW